MPSARRPPRRFVLRQYLKKSRCPKCGALCLLSPRCERRSALWLWALGLSLTGCVAWSLAAAPVAWARACAAALWLVALAAFFLRAKSWNCTRCGIEFARRPRRR